RHTSPLFPYTTLFRSILNLAIQKATLSERYHQGGTVGYVITAVLIIGILIAIYKFITLTAEAGKMRSQLKNIDNPSSNNALGRILAVYKENQSVDVETLEMKLDEAILRETPRIDRSEERRVGKEW